MAHDKIVIMDGEIHRTEKTYINDIEYIRKDALLEWAKEQASITEKLNGKGAMLKAWDSLINKIESL